MTALATTTSASWASAHRAMLFVIGALLAVAAAAAIVLMLTSGRTAPVSGTTTDADVLAPAPYAFECSPGGGPC